MAATSFGLILSDPVQPSPSKHRPCFARAPRPIRLGRYTQSRGFKYSLSFASGESGAALN